MCKGCDKQVEKVHAELKASQEPCEKCKEDAKDNTRKAKD